MKTVEKWSGNKTIMVTKKTHLISENTQLCFAVSAGSKEKIQAVEMATEALFLMSVASLLRTCKWKSLETSSLLDLMLL